MITLKYGRKTPMLTFSNLFSPQDTSSQNYTRAIDRWDILRMSRFMIFLFWSSSFVSVTRGCELRLLGNKVLDFVVSRPQATTFENNPSPGIQVYEQYLL